MLCNLSKHNTTYTIQIQTLNPWSYFRGPLLFNPRGTAKQAISRVSQPVSPSGWLGTACIGFAISVVSAIAEI